MTEGDWLGCIWAALPFCFIIVPSLAANDNANVLMLCKES